MTEQERKNCFIIMPFSDTKSHDKNYWDGHYKYLESLLSVFPLRIHRSEALRGDIVKQIITDLVTSHIVIADLTDLNANVFWELGVRQSFKHCTITIFEENNANKTLPFDLAAKGTLFYQPNVPIKMVEFVKKFNSAINDCIINPNYPDSYVLEAISGRGTLFQILMKQESIRKLEALITEIDSNLKLFERIAKICSSNAELRKSNNTKTTFPVRNYRIMAAESLWVNRYVETNESFYQTLDDYISYALMNNTVILHWIESKDTEKRLEDWILRNNETFYKAITKLRVIVLKEKNKITLMN